jgi:hypothetical protein
MGPKVHGGVNHFTPEYCQAMPRIILLSPAMFLNADSLAVFDLGTQIHEQERGVVDGE